MKEGLNMLYRLENVRKELKELGLDALLVSTPYNIRYLSNFTGTTAQVLVTLEDAYFITDFRYADQAKAQAKGFKIRIQTDGVYQEINDILIEDKIERLGIEADNMTVSTYMELSDLFEVEIIETKGLIEKIREIKDETEVQLIKDACAITDAAFDHILGFIKAGQTTEIEVANELERFCKSKGSTGMSFDTIVASGLRSAMPHGVASEKVIEEGELVTLDFGCYYKGYTSDMTRTIAVGQVDDKLKEIYQVVYDAHMKVTQEAKPGMTGAEIDAIARDYISEKGYGEYFGHSTGHGIGLDIHEGPAISRLNHKPVVAGQMITNEPGIYISGLGGVRIEDDLIVTEDGMIPIQTAPRDLITI